MSKRSLWRCSAMIIMAMVLFPIPEPCASVDTTPVAVQRTDTLTIRQNKPSPPFPDALAMPAQGRLLVATKKLQDPRFKEAVVFLVQYSSSGAMGLIINRPSKVRLADVLMDLPALKKRQDVVFYGGPVEGRRMFLLIRSSSMVNESVKVLGDIHMSTSKTILEHLIAEKVSIPFRSYAGYAGWAPGQLDAEIAHGDWQVAKADAQIIFEQNPALLWPRLIRDSLEIQV